MITDISRTGDVIIFTFDTGKPKRKYVNTLIGYGFQGDGDLEMKFIDETIIIPTGFTVQSGSVANEAAALTAIDELFPDADATAITSDAVTTALGFTPVSQTDMRNYYSSKLTKWKQKLISSPGTAKMIFVGDSTSLLANTQLDTLIGKYTHEGDVLYGFNVSSNMPDFGSNGDTIANFYDQPNGTKHLNAVIAAAPDLIIFSYGINDVRTSSEMSKATLKTYIINCVNAFKSALPDVEIVLRMPNSLLSTSVNGYIQQGSYGSLALAAQGKTDILYYAYKELENYWEDVVLFDSQNLVWGRTCRASADWMTDELHPKQEYAIKQIVDIVGYKPTVSNNKLIRALYKTDGTAATTYATPWTLEPRVLEYEKNFEKLTTGRLAGQSAGSYLDITINPFSDGVRDAYDALGKILTTDIINIGDNTIFVINANALQYLSATSKTTIRISNLTALPSNSLPVNTPVTFYRSIFNHTYAAEQYVGDKLNYPYRRRVYVLAASNGYVDLGFGVKDALNPQDIFVGNQLELSTSDIFLGKGGAAISLTGATFAPNSTYLRITKAGTDFSSYYNTYAFIFGNHAYEKFSEVTLTAAGTTGNQTINKQGGSVNIAAAGTSVTVTNSMIKNTSLVNAWVMTNDTNKTRVTAVTRTNGSATIYVDPAPAAEIAIGFMVFN